MGELNGAVAAAPIGASENKSALEAMSVARSVFDDSEGGGATEAGIAALLDCDEEAARESVGGEGEEDATALLLTARILDADGKRTARTGAALPPPPPPLLIRSLLRGRTPICPRAVCGTL
jgi:hypothetical protein